MRNLLKRSKIHQRFEQDSEAEEFYEAEVDPDAELIQAPKIKLDGLKILGKN